MSKAAEAAAETSEHPNADNEAPPAYEEAPAGSQNSSAPGVESQEPPPSHYADRVQQMNREGKQRAGDPKPEVARTEWDVITVPMRVSDYGVTPLKEERRTGTLSKFKALVKTGSTGDDYTTIFMTRGEYSRHWAKDTTGQFKEDVTEPEGGRKAWLEEQMVLSQKYRQSEKEYQKEMHKFPHGDSKKNQLKWLMVEAQDRIELPGGGFTTLTV